MSTMIFSFVLATVFSLIALGAAHKKWTSMMFVYSILAFFCGLGSLKFAVEDVGYGRVPEVVEPIAQRLKVGVSYQVIGSLRDGNEHIVLVKPYQGDKKTPKLFALRVEEEGLPPVYFTMIGDKPVAIMIAK